MTTSNATHHRHALWAPFVLAVLLLVPVHADADEFGLFNGKVLGVWKTTATIGVGFRAGTPQSRLVGAGAGQGDTPEFAGASGAVGVNDDAELNFPKAGSLYSAPLALNSELSLTHSSGQGVFVRMRAWYDMALKGNDVPHGNAQNVYTPNSRLGDGGMLGAAAFGGIDIYDAFFFGHYKVGGTRLLLRVGRQAVDWGEGLFYPGINAFNPMDFAWATTTGARVTNGGRLPVNRIYANVTGPAGFIFDGFVNLEFRPNVYPGCGTYFSNLDNGVNPGCNITTAAGLPDRPAALLIGTKNFYEGQLYAGGRFPDGATDTRPMSGKPSRWSGWGVSVRKFVEPIKTEVGFYYTGYTSLSFVNASVNGPTPLDYSINTMYPTGVKAFAVSASTGLRDLALSAQLTRTLDFPGHYNAPAYIEGSIQGTGPFGFMKAECIDRECQTYARVNTTQLQYGGTWQFGRFVGLTDATLTAEADMQWNTNLPPVDGPNAIRLGRYGNFGDADWTNTQGYVCNPGPLKNGIINSCAIDGFASPFAMGYKLRATTTLPPVGPGLTLTPALTFGQDVTGFSVDGFTVVGGRAMVAVFLRVDTPKQKYFVELNMVRYRAGAEWDPLRDRGQYTAVLGYNFR